MNRSWGGWNYHDLMVVKAASCWDLLYLLRFVSFIPQSAETHTQFQSSRSLPVKCCVCIFLMRCFRIWTSQHWGNEPWFSRRIWRMPCSDTMTRGRRAQLCGWSRCNWSGFLTHLWKMPIYIIYNTYNYIEIYIDDLPFWQWWFSPSYVRLPEGILYKSDIIFIPPPTWRIPSLVK